MSAERGRVLQVFPYHLGEGTGGASGVRTAIESTIALTGDEWQHVVLVPGPSPYIAAFERLGADVRSLGRGEHLVLRRGSSPVAVLRHACRLLVDVPRIAALIRRERIDIVHSHSSAYLGAALAARLASRPVLVHVHERMDAIDPRLARLYRRLVARIATCVVVIAEFLQVEWEGSGARIVYVPNTARCLSMPSGEQRDPVVGFVGRVAPRKGIEHLVRAFALVRARRADARLVVVGGPAEPEDFTYLARLEQDVRELGVVDGVSFFGPTDDVGAALDGFRVLAFTSPVDIAPITVLEAMAHGLPVVAASDGGAEEMVVDGETGFTVAPRDEEALAERLAQLLEDGDLCSRMGVAARRRLETVYGPARYGEALKEIYAAFVQGR